MFRDLGHRDLDRFLELRITARHHVGRRYLDIVIRSDTRVLDPPGSTVRVISRATGSWIRPPSIRVGVKKYGPIPPPYVRLPTIGPTFPSLNMNAPSPPRIHSAR
jgi:hypothetical protein